MLIPADIEEKLGFDKIRKFLLAECSSDHSRELAHSLTFESTLELLRPRIEQAREMFQLLSAGSIPPIQYTSDIRSQLKYIRTPGTFLQPEDFIEVAKAMQSSMALQTFFNEKKDATPFLYEIAKKIDVEVTLVNRINAMISEDAEVRDLASAELANIRKGLYTVKNKLRKSLDRIFRQAVKDGYVPEKSSITVRDGRMVIPVLAEYKRRLRGFIHDESSTGQTVYLEPADVLESNNEIRELEYAERREIIRILTRLTDALRDNLPALQVIIQQLAALDLIRAKGRLAIALEATVPELSARPNTTIINARHPLLYLNYKKSNKEVVPLSLSLDPAHRIMIISGPNAGGKSVCLKTMGLLQYMWQCGLLVPVDEGSIMGLYSDIFLDIGDEQSIDNDLSTYSSHLTFMREFLVNAAPSSLVLIDEFGTGTDPLFGGAMAEGILVKLIEKKCRAMITTHYGNIKRFAEEHDNVVNGAMKYDLEHLTPLYQLQSGIPGSSFTFEVARKIGLPDEIIAYARAVAGKEQTDVEELLLQLEKQQQQIGERDKALATKEAQTQQLLAKYQTLLEELESNKKKIMSQAKEEASDLLKKTNREIERTIRHIKENQAEKKETRRVRDRLEGLKKEVDRPALIKEKQNLGSEASLMPGDAVRLIGRDVVGEVIALRGKDVEIQIGALKTTTKRANLELISRGEAKKVNRKHQTLRSNVDLSHKLATFNHTLDVRGKRGNEILEIVDKFIDDALLFNASEVRILHGKGDGILRRLIRDHLKRHTNVSSAADEHVEHGGAGITLVGLK